MERKAGTGSLIKLSVEPTEGKAQFHHWTNRQQKKTLASPAAPPCLAKDTSVEQLEICTVGKTKVFLWSTLGSL